jgi:hypothetical protein
MSISIEFLPIVVSAIFVPALVAASSIQPKDLAVQYQWRTGSVSPPHQYSYTVSIDAQGHGQVAMRSSYGKSPEWKESFQVPQIGMDNLYQTFRKNDFNTRRWQQLTRVPVGGPHQSLTITANNQSFKLQDYVVKDQQAAANEMYGAVKVTVPEEIWTKLQAKRQQYVNQNSKK